MSLVFVNFKYLIINSIFFAKLFGILNIGKLMLKKIEKELEEFTNTIKEVEGCDKMISYLNSSIISSVKLMMFASKTFSLYGRVLLFTFLTLGGFLIFLSIGTNVLDTSFLIAIILVLFVSIIFYITHFKKLLLFKIEDKKSKFK